MFKNPFQVAIVFAMVALVIKVALFTMGVQHGMMEEGIRYIYLFIILCAVFFGIRSNKYAVEGGKTTFGQDFKAGARTASFFAILTGVITYIYYANIDSDFFTIKQQPLLDELYEKVSQEAGDKSKKEIQEILTNQIYSIKMMLSPYFHAMWTMFGLVFIGLAYSAIFSLLMRKMLKAKK